MSEMQLMASSLHPKTAASITRQPEELEQRLLRGEVVNDLEVHQVFERFSGESLSNEARDVCHRVTRFYSAAIADDGPLKRRMRRIGSLLAGIPFFETHISAGQLFCDNYDPIARRFLALCSLRRGEIDETTFMRRDLPDFDVISVLKPGAAGPFRPRPFADEALRCRTATLCRNWGGWGELLHNLKSQANVAAVKLTSNVREREGLIEAFLRNGSIALCMANPLPFELWRNLPLLVADDDSRYLNCLRDLMIGLPPLPPCSRLSAGVPDAFRENLLLTKLFEKPSSMEEWLTGLSRLIAATMPERPMHFAAAGLRAYCAGQWQLTVHRLEEQGLIADTPLRLKAPGRRRALAVVEQRAAFLKAQSPR